MYKKSKNTPILCDSTYKELYGTYFVCRAFKNTYFIGTNKGINIVQNNKFIKLINKSEGLTDIQFNDCIKDKYGNLLIATNDGLIQLNVTEVLKSNERNKNQSIFQQSK